MKLTKENVTVELADTGALLDAGLLRLFVIDEGTKKSASYLTLMGVDAAPEKVAKALTMLMDVACERIQAGMDIKRLCRKLSWIHEGWLEDQAVCPICDGDGCTICAHTGQITLASLRDYVCDEQDLTKIRLVFPAHAIEEEKPVEQPL